jgi:hypothetical protein
MFTSYDKNHIEEIIYEHHGDWFNARLLRLIYKADGSNREKLRLVYPEQVKAIENMEARVYANL